MCIAPVVSDSAHDLHQLPGKKAAALDDLHKNLRKRAPLVERAAVPAGQDNVLNWEQLAAHGSKDDCWIAVKGRVYDVTHFAKDHPGGRVIYEYAGRDATDVFSAFHNASAWAMLRPHLVGTVQEGAPVSAVAEDFRALRAQLQAEGLFTPSRAYYAWKLVSTLGLVAGGLATLVAAPGSVLAQLASALLVALGLQQSGWLAHDFCHNQVLKTPGPQRAFFNYLMGNVVQGFSVAWWKDKHNTHHAVPNAISSDGEAAPLDPDIDTIPYLAWSQEQLEAARARKTPFFGLMRIQHHLLLPLLLVARVAWGTASIETAVTYALTSWWGVLEVGLLALHYCLVYGPAFALLPMRTALAYFGLVQALTGFLIGFVFVQSHNGMEVYSEPKDFASAQIVSTRNVAPSRFNDWFTGGLNYQIEHHLFPSLPRHNFHLVAPRVRTLCAKHGLEYQSVSMGHAMSLVLAHLRGIAKSV